MSALDQLARTLHNVSQVALARMRLGDSLQIAHERSKLIDWLGGTSELDESTGDRIADALRAFEQNQYVAGLRQARLICYGCTQPFGTPPQRLIENNKLFAILLEYVDRHYYRTRAFRKCYRGLLNCYFSYDPADTDSLAEGRGNWELLRQFLVRRKDSLDTPDHNPAWIAALSAHHNLLDNDPCKPYQLKDIEENLAVFDDLRERLEISNDSWIIRKIVFSQIKDAIALDDASFGANIDGLLLLLIAHPLHAGAALILLLNRHVRCEKQEIGATLRDFSVKQWGNPWLAGNAHLWQCSAEAREMVARSLKRHLLDRFLSILSDDGADDPRRLNFWELYCGDMLGMYFALGGNAFIRGNLDLHKFRQDAKGLVVRLTEGKSDTHALILQFGEHHVVEFSNPHNPAYFYDTRHGLPPFYLSKGWVEIGALSASKITQGVGTSARSKALRHHDGNQLAWEGKFAELLGATENAIKAFCGKYQCIYEDLRSQGGQEWIRPTEQTRCGTEGWAVLLGWGFKPSRDEAGFCRV
ncbi:MAG TPA: EH signature domain-containing protein [Gallionella sp.]|nr:EH signature domain-containing protein [Gallionella sp.]